MKKSSLALLVIAAVAVAVVASLVFFNSPESATSELKEPQQETSENPAQTPANTANQTGQASQPGAVAVLSGAKCFSRLQKATASAPYTVDEKIKLDISGEKVTGTKSGTQIGPDMTNGYTGTLTGTYKNNVIDVLYSYTVEGSQNKEQEEYDVTANGLVKKRWPLKDENGILVPDKTQTSADITYNSVDCSTL